MAALCHERWAIEGALAELETRPRGARVVLRGKTPELARQEFRGLLPAPFALRGLLHEAALRGPMRTRTGARSRTRCAGSGAGKLPLFAALPPRARRALHEAVLAEILEGRGASSRGRRVPRGVKRRMSRYRLRPRTPQPTVRIDFTAAIRVLK